MLVAITVGIVFVPFFFVLDLPVKAKLKKRLKRVAIFVILVVLTAGFSSCSAVRHCQAPRWRCPGQIAPGYTDSLTIADLNWWQFYGDSTLRRVIELTLEKLGYACGGGLV